jgi:PAS domain S-box-containing protein
VASLVVGYALEYLFGAASFVPHGYCLLWRPDLVALHAVSDLLIACAYFSIPAVIYLFVRRRRDFELGWVLYLFVTFIFLCGTTHLVSLITLWLPYYGLQGLIKLLTAAVSLGTAIVLWPILPKALALPSPSQLKLTADQLGAQIEQRERAEQSLREANIDLERRVEARTDELERANARLREREREMERQSRLLKTIFETIEQGISVFDSDMRLVVWNRHFPQYLNLPAELLCEGLPLTEIFRFQARQGWLGEGDIEMLVERQWQKIVGGDELLTNERRHQPDGRIIDIRRYPFPDGGVVSTFTNVTETSAAEERFRMAVEASPSGMIMVDRTGKVILANREAERLFGYSRTELLELSVDMLVPQALRGKHAQHREHFAAQPEKRAMGAGRELFGQRKDGSYFPVEIGLNPIVRHGVLLVLAAIIDITERRQGEMALARQTRELQRSNAELEQFAYVASHDLREPLRMVASYTELLAERYRGRLDEKADKYISYAVSGAKRMQQLVDDLLSYSRIGTQGKPLQPTDASAVARRVMRAMKVTIEQSGAEIVCDDLPRVLADETQFGQLLQNLISNAIKFRAAGRAPRIRISAAARDRMGIFSVEDNGIGIEEQYAGRIFQMFQRLHGRGEYEGSGIGLAIAKKIVERHSGQIWFTSQQGCGTTFFFSIPAGGGDAET